MMRIRICSSHDASGKGYDIRGKLWRWDFSERFGPLFVTAKGEPLKNQPMTENHVAWIPFETWLKTEYKGKKASKCC